LGFIVFNNSFSFLVCFVYLAGHADGYEGDAAIDVAPAAQVEGQQDGDQVLCDAHHPGEAGNLQYQEVSENWQTSLARYPCSWQPVISTYL
jgi:hypothetical protein